MKTYKKIYCCPSYAAVHGLRSTVATIAIIC